MKLSLKKTLKAIQDSMHLSIANVKTYFNKLNIYIFKNQRTPKSKYQQE
jgi:hypothetical protein